MKTFYEILEVRREATQEEIKSAYRKLVNIYHPDRNPDPIAQHKIKEVNLAYDTLGDVEKRKAYDYRLSLGWHDIVTETQQPPHRDPYFRRKDQKTSKRTIDPGPNEYEMMKRYLSKMLIFCYLGIFVTLLLALDKTLKPVETIEVVDKMEKVTIANSYRVHIRTLSGKNIRLSEWTGFKLIPGTVFTFQTSALYHIPLQIANESGEKKIFIGYIFTSLLFFPIILLGTSVGAVVVQKRVQLSFNLAIVSAILLILNVYLIFH